MKKNLVLATALVALTGSLVSCGESAPKTETYRLGLGSMMYIYNNDNASHVKGHKVQVKVASVIFDKEDKIVDTSIDEIQVPLALDAEGNIVLNTKNQQMVTLAPAGQSVASKKEIGENYGQMTSGKWYQEVERFERWTIGRTLAEVEAAPDDTGHLGDVVTGCSINMGDGHIPTMSGAFKMVKEFTVEGDVLPRASLGACSTYTKGNSVEFTIDASALVDNKIASTVLDVYQAPVKSLGKDEKNNDVFGFDETQKQYTLASELVHTKGSLIASKKELGDKYGMGAVTGKEWYKHAEAYEAWCEGKTVEEVKANINDDGKASAEELQTGCTIGVKGFLDAVVESFTGLRAE